MDFKKTIGLLISIILLIGIVTGVALVKRQQKIEGEAVETSEPKAYRQEDFNGDGKVDNQDFVIFREKYAAKDPAADLDDSGEVNSLDYNLFLSKME